jgi:hypothetical protein
MKKKKIKIRPERATLPSDIELLRFKRMFMEAETLCREGDCLEESVGVEVAGKLYCLFHKPIWE